MTEGALLDIAIAAAHAGGEVIMKAHRSRRPGTITAATAKGHNDYVTAVDREAEARIVSVIRELYPDHGIQAEESTEAVGSSEYRWIIDPLDGTTNFMHGFPMFSVSIGLSHNDRMKIGVVFDPLRGELFTAEAGKGAFLNGEPIRVSGVADLREALLLTGFPFRAQQYLKRYLGMFEELFRASSGMRRAGSAALDLAYVACGRAEGFFELALSPWDMAAGAVLVIEAGGVVTDFTGGEDYIGAGHIVAGGAPIVEQMLPHIANYLPLW